MGPIQNGPALPGRGHFVFSPRAWLLALALWSVTTGVAAAQPDVERPDPRDLKKLSLEELFDLEVTTLSTKPEPLSEAAAAVRIVTGDDVRRMGALSIPEALRYVPGLEVARVDSHQYAITARGFNGTVANKLLVLIDGRSVYTPLFSGVFWDAQDAFLEDIEQIEIIRGPGATVWGANAVNGVINVISKPARDTRGLLVTGGGGNVERGFGGFRYGGALGPRAAFRVYGKGFGRGASLHPDGREAGDEFTMGQGGFRADWARSTTEAFTLQGDLYAGSIDRAGAEDAEIAGGNVIARWSRGFADGSNLQWGAYYDRTNRNMPGVFEEKLDTYDVSLRHRFAPGGPNDLVWGLGYRQTFDRIRNSPGLAFLPEELKQRVFSGFVQNEVALADRRILWTLGSKVERNDYTGLEYQPSTRLAWTPKRNQTVWGALSRAVRAPSRIDRDLFAPASPPYFLAGGPRFESEVLRAYELGYRRRGRTVTVSVAAFYDAYDRLRSLESGAALTLANGLKGTSRGVETSANVQALGWWRLSAGHTYLNLELETSPGSADTTQVKQAGDSPRHQWFLWSSMALPHALELDLGVRSVHELRNQNVPAYVACDARLAWQPSRALEIAVAGAGLFDPRHPEFGAPASRREGERSLYVKGTWRP